LKIESGGQFDVPSGYTNHDEILLADGDARITGSVLTNHGLLRGSGRILAVVDNEADGEIEVADVELDFISDLSNANQINVNNGTLRVQGEITNASSTGFIAGENATFRFSGGFTNNGAVALSFGTSRIFGDIDNDGGTITVSGASNVTFYDDVVNEGTIHVSAGTNAVYFGAVSGSGSFSGSGTNFFEGDLAPGSSSGMMSFGGDVVLGPLSTTQIELGALPWVNTTGYWWLECWM